MSGLSDTPGVTCARAEVLLSPLEGVLVKTTLLPACTSGAHIHQSGRGAGSQEEEGRLSRSESVPP